MKAAYRVLRAPRKGFAARLMLPAAGSRVSAKTLCLALTAALILLLAGRFALYLDYALSAVSYPFELDYGEGIVWQQAMLIPGPRMYGDITRYPFIVFHYPPFYHLVVHALAALGVHPLVAGRSLSLAASLVMGFLVAALTVCMGGHDGRRVPGLAGAAVAGFGIFAFWPVMVWAPLMRVDMLGIALSLFGVWCAIRSAGRPWLLYLGMVAFVLAVFTKQTFLAAPVATVTVMLAVNPRLTIRACGLGLLLGGSALAVLTAMTDGGFERHILLYNINRYSLRAVADALWMLLPHATFVIVAAFGWVACWWRYLAGGTRPGLAAMWQDLKDREDGRALAIMTLYLALTSAMLLTLGKSGGGPNYFIEWMSVLSVLIGSLVARTVGNGLGRRCPPIRSPWIALLPAALLAQVVILPVTPGSEAFKPQRMQALAGLLTRVKAVDRPVLSDDMVLLMQAGKDVVWEPSIFAELASTGAWDERAIVDMIMAHRFAFIMTQGRPGSALFDSRYTPAVQRAIFQAYPDIEEDAGHTVHLPPDAAL